MVFLVHRPGLSARALLMDDSEYLEQNLLLTNPGWGSAKRFLTEVFEPSTVPGSYIPLTMISMMLDHAQGGGLKNLYPFHRTSLILHVMNTALVVVLWYLLFGQVWVAALAGLLFGVHPLTVERITWVADRKTVLTTFFALWCLVLYVIYVRRGTWRWWAGSLLTYVLALMSKPTSLPLPFLLLLLDYWPLQRLCPQTTMEKPAEKGKPGRPALSLLIEKGPFFIVCGVWLAIAFVSFKRTTPMTLPGERAWGDSLLIFCHNVLFYLTKIFWPTNLSVHYPAPEPLGLEHPMVRAGVIGACVLTVVILVSWRRTRALAAGCGFFLAALSPTMGAVGFSDEIAANRFAYFPMLGLLLMVGGLFGKLWTFKPLTRRITLGAILTLAATGSLAAAESMQIRRYLGPWSSTEKLCKYMIATTPEAFFPHYGWAIELENQGRIDEAMAQYRQVLLMKPGYYQACNGLGHAWAMKGDYEEAIKWFTKAVRLYPDYAAAHGNLAAALTYMGKYEEAVWHYEKALELKSDYLDARRNYAATLLHYLGRTESAMEQYRKILELNRRDGQAHCGLGDALLKQGNLEEAIRHYREALWINPELAAAKNGLQRALAQQDQPKDK